MSILAPFKRLILRAVLYNGSPMVIRILAAPDSLRLLDFDEVFRAVLGWDHIGFLFRVHGQKFNSFRRATGSKTLCEFQLRPSETFLYTCGAVDLWEWEIGLLDEESGSMGRQARTNQRLGVIRPWQIRRCRILFPHKQNRRSAICFRRRMLAGHGIQGMACGALGAERSAGTEFPVPSPAV
jgi:hypothetical protein